MKTPEEIKPNYGPVYAAAMYPELAGIFQAHGYALAVHGSLARDFDLIAVPWVEAVSDVQTVFAAVEAKFAVNILREAETRAHGRTAYTLCVGFGHCAIDLSFLPSERTAFKANLTADLEQTTGLLEAERIKAGIFYAALERAGAPLEGAYPHRLYEWADNVKQKKEGDLVFDERSLEEARTGRLKLPRTP